MIDLTRGDPDLPPPTSALEVLRDTIKEPGVHRYPLPTGGAELRVAFANYYMERYHVRLDPDTEIALVPGVRTAIMALVAVACAEGDEVVVPNPGYPDYLSACALSGARPRALRLEPRDGYQPDWDSVDEVHESLLFLNYPSNPTGACAQRSTFCAAVDRADRLDSWVVNDFVYADIGTDEAARSILAEAGAKDRAVELWSGSKTFGMAGWRIGFAVGNATLVERIRLYLGHTTGGVWTGFQRGLLAALTNASAELGQRAAIFDRRQAQFSAHGKAAGVVRPPATYYSWWRLPDCADVAMVEERARVRVVDGALFGTAGVGFARAALTVSENDVTLAAERLAEFAARTSDGLAARDER